MMRLLVVAALLAAASSAEARGLRRGFKKRCTNYPATTNLALQSGALSTGTAATSPWALWQATVTTSTEGGKTWTQVTSASADGPLYQVVTIPASTTVTFSALTKKASGTGTAGVTLRCGAGATPTCSCARSDAGACTATTSGANDCNATATVGTTAVRLEARAVCTVNTTTPTAILYGTTFDAAGTSQYTEAQLQAGASFTRYVPTTSAAVTSPAGCY